MHCTEKNFIANHRRITVFGFALLVNKTESKYIWLLETFMRAMEGKQPTTIITDEDRAMRNAISKTFPRALHRLCCWYLVRNAQKSISSKDFTKDFQAVCCSHIAKINSKRNRNLW